LTLIAVLKLITPLLSSSWLSWCLDVLVVGRLDAHLGGLFVVVFMIFLMFLLLVILMLFLMVVFMVVLKLLLLVVFMVFSMIFVGSVDGIVVGCLVAHVF
jgi:hypothetical protein